MKCNYCLNTFKGHIFRFKHHLVGTRYESEPCVSVPEEIKVLILKVVSEAKYVSMNRRRLNSLEQINDGEKNEQSVNTSKIF